MTLKKPLVDAHNHRSLDLRLSSFDDSFNNPLSDHFDILKDQKFMRLAIQQAKLGEKNAEVPVGAIIVNKNGKIVAKAANLREKYKTTLGHAELVAVHRACKKLDSWRLSGCTLYVTLEPCFMCAGALVQSRISRVVFAAHDPKGGAIESLARLGKDSRLNHQFQISSGILASECSLLLKDFFKKKRKD